MASHLPKLTSKKPLSDSAIGGISSALLFWRSSNIHESVHSPQSNLITFLTVAVRRCPRIRADSFTGLQPVSYNQKPTKWWSGLAPALIEILTGTTRLTTISFEALVNGIYLAVNSRRPSLF